MEIVRQKIAYLRVRTNHVGIHWVPLRRYATQFFKNIRRIGFSAGLNAYENRKLGVFNLLNFFQLLTGLFLPFLGMLHNDGVPNSAWVVACLPAVTSISVLYLNHLRKHEAALLTYFIAYPFFTCIVYLNGMDAGTELHFVLYGILSVFFLADIGYMLFTIAWSMVSYFILAVVLKEFIYPVEEENITLYLLNQLVAIVFLFYGLYLIKKENTEYQFRLIKQNRALHKKNLQIKQQKQMVAEKAALLHTQANELAELNSLKNRLFSVIAHDLKAPMYALRSLFQNMQHYNLPAAEIKSMIPEVVKDMNDTIGLMENLLQWSKTQMQADAVVAQEINVTELIADVVKLLRLQAEAKAVTITCNNQQPIHVFADRDMIQLVLRNLVSNAIKFTPQNGSVAIGINRHSYFAEVFVQDTGTGISEEALKKIHQNIFYTTKGTASESGTGLGLMLCKEFLAKNGGQMHIESKLGQGSIFSFTLPVTDARAQPAANN